MTTFTELLELFSSTRGSSSTTAPGAASECRPNCSTDTTTPRRLCKTCLTSGNADMLADLIDRLLTTLEEWKHAHENRSFGVLRHCRNARRADDLQHSIHPQAPFHRNPGVNHYSPLTWARRLARERPVTEPPDDYPRGPDTVHGLDVPDPDWICDYSFEQGRKLRGV